MLPGKAYTLQDVLQVARRRFWVLLVPLAVSAAATATFARRIPDTYAAETVVLVVPQKVPEDYVKPTVTETLEGRLQSIRPTLLSRTRLESLIDELNLYPVQRQMLPMEDVVALMRRNVDIDTRGGDSFSIKYSGSQPQQVMDVANRLALMFVDESLRDRRSQAEGTNQFLDSQLQVARAKLVEKEASLVAYRREHAGELPTQIEANLQQGASAQARLGATRDSINRDQERRLLIEQRLATLQSARADAVVASPDATSAPRTAQQQLVQAQATVEALMQRGLKPGHPDLDEAQRRMRSLKQAADAEAEAIASNAPRSTSAAETERHRLISDAQGQIAEIDRQIAKKNEDARVFQAAADDAQRRVDALPTRESEMTALMRDYGTLQQSYNDLLAKKQESQIAANLEDRQIGEQFRVLDTARLPERPVSPNRVTIDLAGAMGGLGVGAVLLALMIYRDRSLRTEDDVTLVLGLPALAVIPEMRSAAEQRTHLWWKIATHGGLAGIVAVCAVLFVRAVW